MVKIYTKTGDKGETSLVSGTRIKKSDSRIDLYGEVDELNSFLGLAISYLKDDSHEKEYLVSLQSLLFNIGSHLACEKEKNSQYNLPHITEKNLMDIEVEIDCMSEKLDPLKEFILPGGCLAASTLHVCRTVCRRIERKLMSFYDENTQEFDGLILKIFNRLSDYFFIVARYENKNNNQKEFFWKKS